MSATSVAVYVWVVYGAFAFALTALVLFCFFQMRAMEKRKAQQ